MSVSPSKESEDVFSGCKSLTEIAIPSGVASIGEMAFYECEGLCKVSFGEGEPSLGSIGSDAFYNCGSLAQFDFPSTLQRIGESAFSRTALTAASLPDALTQIGGQAFSGCRNLSVASFANPNTVLAQNALPSASEAKGLTIYSEPNGSVAQYAHENGIRESRAFPCLLGERQFRLKSLTSEESGVTLHEGSDYELSLSENYIDAGDVTAVFTGKGAYQGNVAYEYTIEPKSLSDNDVSVTVEDMECTGEQLKPQPVISYAGKAAPPECYAVTYDRNVEVGVGGA